MATGYIKVVNNTADKSIYLADCGRRTSNPSPVPRRGQEQYVKPGQTVFLLETSDVILSKAYGCLKVFAAKGYLTVTAQATLGGGEALTVFDAPAPTPSV